MFDFGELNIALSKLADRSIFVDITNLLKWSLVNCLMAIFGGFHIAVVNPFFLMSLNDDFYFIRINLGFLLSRSLTIVATRDNCSVLNYLQSLEFNLNTDSTQF